MNRTQRGTDMQRRVEAAYVAQTQGPVSKSSSPTREAALADTNGQINTSQPYRRKPGIIGLFGNFCLRRGLAAAYGPLTRLRYPMLKAYCLALVKS